MIIDIKLLLNVRGEGYIDKKGTDGDGLSKYKYHQKHRLFKDDGTFEKSFLKKAHSSWNNLKVAAVQR